MLTTSLSRERSPNDLQVVLGNLLRMRRDPSSSGLVLVTPLSCQRFRVTEDSYYRTLPSESAHACTPLRPVMVGEVVTPAIAALDVEGQIEWLGVPTSIAIGSPDPPNELFGFGKGTGNDPSMAEDELAVPASTLREHLRVLTSIADAIAWLPFVSSDGTLLLEEMLSEVSETVSEHSSLDEKL